MKKEENLNEGQPKHRPVYRYELQATNQILKDTLDLCHSSLYSTAHTNKPTIHLNSQESPPPHRHATFTPAPEHSLSKPRHHKQSRGRSFGDFCRQKNEKKLVFQEFGYIQNSFDKDLQPRNKNKKQKEPSQYEGEAFFNSQYFSFSSENDPFPSNRPHTPAEKSIENSSKRGYQQAQKKDLKKQRRGLAEISLKVKNIVARMRKMTFKEVSDEVLKESQDDLPTDPEQREKETKNIRRRVYDALNVLVSVKILGKEQRCVVHTDETNIPGKKLSEHWHIINEKNRILQQKEQQYEKKLANLNLLKKNIEMVQMFHSRNRKINEAVEKREESTRSQAHQFNYTDRYLFPLVFLIPPKNLTNKIKIQLEYQEQNGEQIKKITIDNNDYILTDLDVLKYLNLSKPQKEDQPTPKDDNIFLEKVGAGAGEKDEEDKGDLHGNVEIYLGQ